MNSWQPAIRVEGAVSLAYEFALLATIALVGWCALDVLFDATRRRRLACVAVLASAALAWAAGTLLQLSAATPAEVLTARRICFAGIALLPPAWVWCALHGSRLDGRPGARRLFGLLLVPSLAAYAFLFVAPNAAFVDWYAQPIRRGPVFYLFAAYSWTLIVVGAAVVLRSMRASEGGLRAQRIGMAIAAALPLAANAVYLVLGMPPWPFDPTPLAFGASAVLFRLLVVDVTWAAQHPPLARAEVVSQMQDAVLVADRERRVSDWNEAAATLFGGAIEQGRPLDALLRPVLRDRRRALEVREFPLRRRGAEFGGGVVVADRTAQRNAEIRAEMATRLEALGYLTAGVAHEINNPLTYVSANLAFVDPLVEAVARLAAADQLPAQWRSLAQEAPQMLTDAREGTERIQRVVEKLSRFDQARAASGPPAPVAMRAAVERAVAMASFGKRESPIEITGEPDLRAHAVESDVIHVVFHLLLNAMQMGGEDVPLVVQVVREGDEIAVRVADRGPGVKDGDLPHLFAPFYTTRRPGEHIGLGLSLCWELARRCGGRLEAANRAGGGAVFTLSLPPEHGPLPTARALLEPL
jgi:signal transduction histidine kinase